MEGNENHSIPALVFQPTVDLLTGSIDFLVADIPSGGLQFDIELNLRCGTLTSTHPRIQRESLDVSTNVVDNPIWDVLLVLPTGSTFGGQLVVPLIGNINPNNAIRTSVEWSENNPAVMPLNIAGSDYFHLELIAREPIYMGITGLRFIWLS